MARFLHKELRLETVQWKLFRHLPAPMIELIEPLSRENEKTILILKETKIKNFWFSFPFPNQSLQSTAHRSSLCSPTGLTAICLPVSFRVHLLRFFFDTTYLYGPSVRSSCYDLPGRISPWFGRDLQHFDFRVQILAGIDFIKTISTADPPQEVV